MSSNHYFQQVTKVLIQELNLRPDNFTLPVDADLSVEVLNDMFPHALITQTIAGREDEKMNAERKLFNSRYVVVRLSNFAQAF